jgi:glycosyltransferase involved in cell wall biosynthesis
VKVLHVIPSVAPSYGGPAYAIREMERSLSALGAEVTTVTTNSDGPAGKFSGQYGVPIAGEHATRVYFSMQSEFYRVSLGLAGWLNRNLQQYDIIHAHALFCFPPVVAAYLARQKRIPYILRPLGVLADYGMSQRRATLKKISVALIERNLLQSAAAVHFTSHEELAEAAKLGIAYRGVVLPLGISAIKPVDRVSKSLEGGKTRLLFLSRLDPKKNLEALIGAVELLRPDYPGIELIVAGGGDPRYIGHLKEVAEKAGVSGLMRWLGHIEDSEKAEQLSRATLFILPSFSENFGVAAVEALANGLPCVVAGGVAISSAIEKAGAGVVTGTNAASVAEGIRCVLRDPQRYQRMSKAAAELARSEFSSDEMGSRLFSLYAAVVGGNLPPIGG